MSKSYLYPFTAIVGQDRIKAGLLVNLVNPAAGGVILSGEKGTGKSTIVRSLEALQSNMKIVELPLNVTEDRLLGAIDIEKAIKEGKKEISKSILMEAHGNILYVDEVNLLSDNIVNALLEVSQSGQCKIEREGISYTYPSEFILIGSMNPEEGDLRSQFLDRFGSYIKVEASLDLYEREQIIKNRLAYEADKEGFVESYYLKERVVEERIDDARAILKDVRPDENIMLMAAEIAIDGNLSGHRGEIFLVEIARALAALDGRKYINMEDLKKAAKLALPHRIREKPDEDLVEEEIDEDLEEEFDESEDHEESESETDEAEGDLEDQLEEETDEDKLDDTSSQDDEEEEIDPDDNDLDQESDKNTEFSPEDSYHDIGESFKLRDLDIEALDRKKRQGTGRRTLVETDKIQGRYYRSVPAGEEIRDIAFDASLRNAAPYQGIRDKKGRAIAIEKSDIREKARKKRTGTTILFLVDASGSMGAEKRMEAVKGAIMSILTDAYQKRDNVGMIAFRKDQAELLLGVTRSVDLAHKKLKDLPTGGKTPLSLGLYRAYEVMKAAMKKDPDTIPVLVLVSDGRGNLAYKSEDPHEEALEIADKIYAEGIQSIVIDTEDDFIKLGLAKDICEHLDGSYYKLEDLRAETILESMNRSFIY